MCVDVDDPWEVFESWWGYGRCVDCQREDRVLFEAMGPEFYDEIAEAAYTLVLNDGVPALTDGSITLIEWSGFSEPKPTYHEFCADPAEVNYTIPPEIESTQAICPQCMQARRWLSEWCHSWLYGRYTEDIIEHWTEGELERTVPFGRLVAACKRRWHTHQGRLMTPEEVGRIVDGSLARLRADLQKMSAA